MRRALTTAAISAIAFAVGAVTGAVVTLLEVAESVGELMYGGDDD